MGIAPTQTSTQDQTHDQKRLDERFMGQALQLALRAAALEEVPVGAILVQAGQVLGEGFNRPRFSDDPTAHAEIAAIRTAARRRGNYRLPGSTLYVTLEPCTMCVGAIVHARVERLVFGALEPKAGAVVSAAQLLTESAFNHDVVVEHGVCEMACAKLLTDFFQLQRQAGKR